MTPPCRPWYGVLQKSLEDHLKIAGRGASLCLHRQVPNPHIEVYGCQCLNAEAPFLWLWCFLLLLLTRAKWISTLVSQAVY